MTGPERSERIQQCALKLFAEKGYESTSVAEIVAAAGVTKPMLYWHFESKSDLAVQLLERYRAEMIDSAVSQFDPAAAGELTPAERIGRMIDGWLDWTEEHPDAVRLLLTPIRGDEVVERTQAKLNARARKTQAALLREFAPDLSGAELEAQAEGTAAVYTALALWHGESPKRRRKPARKALLRHTLGALDLPVASR